MRTSDGGKGDARRPGTIPDERWDMIEGFNKPKKAPWKYVPPEPEPVLTGMEYPTEYAEYVASIKARS